MFQAHLGHIVDLAEPILHLPKFDSLAQLVLKHVVPRLLLPLQQDGRLLKPSLLHGDCWDGNTATDARTGEAFTFDLSSFYGHNEYDVGNWRAPRHKLSDGSYLASYKKHMEVSEPSKISRCHSSIYPWTNVGGQQRKTGTRGTYCTRCLSILAMQSTCLDQIRGQCEYYFPRSRAMLLTFLLVLIMI